MSRRRSPPLFLTATLLLLLQLAPIASASKSKSDVRPISEINGYDIIAIALLAVGLAAAAAGGVGGGTIVVPLLVLVMGFDIKFATPASNFIIVGSAVANALFNLQRRHPFVDRPLVDPDICLAIIPSMMGGAVVGAFFSKMLPSYILSILFAVLLGATGLRTLQKGRKLHNAERKHNNRSSVPSVVDSPLGFQEVKSPNGEASVERTAIAMTDHSQNLQLVESNDREHDELQELLDAEKRFNWHKHATILMCYLGIVAASIGGGVSGCGSTAYWVLLWVEVPWALGFTAFFAVNMTKRRAHKLALGFPFVAGDIEWTRKTVVLFPLGCFVAGIVAGLFGVGGAIVAVPLMLEIGVVPEVASATSALLVLYSSAAASAKFAMFNQIVWDWSIVLCVFAFVVTVVAQVFILGYVRRTGRQSIIVFCIATTVCIGACLMAYSAIKTTVGEAGKPFAVSFCASDNSDE
ncbi:hypothetical protein Gpo141_00001576 [Globisporangium polare]